MADQTRDVELRIAVQTTGQQQVTELAKQLDTLAKEGGAAAPEFERLAAELRKVGEQDAAVSKLGALQTEIEKTAVAFREAATTSEVLGTALTEQTQKTEALREQQAGVRAALEQTSAQVREAKAALDLLKASSDESAKKTTAYKTEVTALATTLARLKATQAEQRAEQQSVNTALRESEVQLRAATKEYDAAAAATARFNKQLDGEKESLDLARASMAQTGVAATELDAAQTEVAQSMERTRTAVLAEIEAYEQLQSIQRAVAESNERNVALARAAADERVAAAKRSTELERERQTEAQRTALATRLAAEQVAAAEQQVAAGAREAQEALHQAFGVVGLRSAQQIEAEIASVRTALGTIRETAGITGAGLAQAMNVGGQRISQLERELRAANGQLTLMDRAAGALSSTLGQFTAGAVFANIIQNAASQVAALAKEALQANVDLQKMELGLKAVYGTSAIAAQQIEFLRNTAQDAGVSVGDISGAFIKFAASAQAANIPISTTNGLFSALTKNAATLGLSGEKVSDMLNALGQMAGKGVVQMEELRGQLGDALPGALPKVAKGLGITTLEMEKMARNGELLASEVFPALQRVLEESGGQVDTISAKWARFKNVMTETSQDLGDNVIGKVVGGIATGLGATLEHLAFTATLYTEKFTNLVKMFTVMGADIAEQGLKFRGFSEQARQAINDIQKESDDKLQKLAGRIAGVESIASATVGAVGKVAEAAGQSITVVGDKIVYVGQQAQAATPGVNANAQAHVAGAAAANQNATAQGKAGGAAAAGGQSAATASGSWTQLSVAYGKVNEVLDQQVKLAKLNVDAKKAEGAASQSLAQLSSNEATARSAAAAAARESVTAQAALTQALETELNVLRAQRDAEIALYNASKTKEEAQRKAIEELSKSIQLKAEELTKNREVTESLKNEVVARQIASETLKDNSTQLYALRAAYTEAGAAAETLRAKKDSSKEGSDRAAAADREAAKAAALYKDALNDQISKLTELARVKQAEFSLQESGIRLAIEESRTAEEVARAKGDMKGATEASNRTKQLEIELLRLQAAAQKAEAEAILASLPLKRAQLELEGKLTEAMKKSLEAEELSAKAKLKQSEITEELANRIGRVKTATEEAAAAANNGAGGFDAMASSMDKASSSADRLGGSLNRVGSGSTRAGAGEAPVMGADGKAVPGFVQKTVMGMDQDAIAVLRQKRDMGLLSSGDKALAEAAYMAETANAASISGMNQAFVSPGVAQQAENRARDAKSILDSIRAMERSANTPSQPSTPGYSAPAAPMAPSTSQGSTHTVNINIGGANTSINTASMADAQALTGLLQQLGDASQRATI